MKEDKLKVLKLAKEFIDICDQNEIWHAVDRSTMLGAIKENGLIDNDDTFNVSMTLKHYEILKELYPQRIIDTDEQGYPMLVPKFMFDKANFLDSSIFINIFILIPTTKKNIKKFKSVKNKRRFTMQITHSPSHLNNTSTKVFKALTHPLRTFSARLSYQEASEILKSKFPEYYYTMDSPLEPEIENRYPILSMRRFKVEFEDFNVYVPVEYDSILRNKYGHSYMEVEDLANGFEHINSVSKAKVRRPKSPKDSHFII